MAQKPVRISYQAKANASGLTDIKAQMYLNGVAKAVGVFALLLAEVDAVNAPGLYSVLISGATLTGWGVSSTQYNYLLAHIDSATHSAKAIWHQELTVLSLDDFTTELQDLQDAMETLTDAVSARTTVDAIIDIELIDSDVLDLSIHVDDDSPDSVIGIEFEGELNL